MTADDPKSPEKSDDKPKKPIVHHLRADDFIVEPPAVEEQPPLTPQDKDDTPR